MLEHEQRELWIAVEAPRLHFESGVVHWTHDPVTDRWSSRVLVAPRGVTQRVRGLRCPVTLIHAGQNSTCSEDEALRFVKHHRHTRRVRIDSATHFLPMEYRETVRKEIVRMGHRAMR